MRHPQIFLFSAVLGLPLLAPAPVNAGDQKPLHSLQVRYEYMEWTEFSLEGRQLLEESGARVGLQWEREMRNETLPDWSVRALVYLGDVDYDGQTQLGEPIESTTEYQGIQSDAAILLPITLIENIQLIPFAGGGGHTWLRRIDDTGGFAETGYNEWWVDLYLQAGLGLRWHITSGEMFARMGARYPVFTRVEYDLTLPDGTDDANVEPDAELAVFGELGYRTGGYTASLFAEQTSYGHSDIKTYGSVNIFQPESELKSFGIQLGVVF